MITATDLQERLKELDLKLITLLRQRAQLTGEVGGRVDPDLDGEMCSFWLEEAGERGLDEVSMEKLYKLVSHLCRASGED